MLRIQIVLLRIGIVLDMKPKLAVAIHVDSIQLLEMQIAKRSTNSHKLLLSIWDQDLGLYDVRRKGSKAVSPKYLRPANKVTDSSDHEIRSRSSYGSERPK